jgi:hypothetical protein
MVPNCDGLRFAKVAYSHSTVARSGAAVAA